MAYVKLQMKDKDYFEIEQPEIGQEGDSELSEDGPLAGCILGFCLCLCLLGIPAIFTAAAWNRRTSCHAQDGQASAGWNTMIPANTSMKYVPKLFWFFWHQVDVLDSAHEPLGFWSDLDLYFGLVGGYAFTDTTNGEVVLMEARKPWKWQWQFGLYFNLWRCGGDEVVDYRIQEDWWARPWFSWNQEKTFNIMNASLDLIAKSYSRTKSEVFGSLWPEKEIIVTDPQGTQIALLREESQLEAGWTYRRFFCENLAPHIIPNEVVSFLGAVWELEDVKERSSISPGSNHRAFTGDNDNHRVTELEDVNVSGRPGSSGAGGGRAVIEHFGPQRSTSDNESPLKMRIP